MDKTFARLIRYPFIQAPMAGSDHPGLVAAASNVGALSSLGAQYQTAEEIRKAIKEVRKLTDKPFAVNLFALAWKTPPSSCRDRGGSSSSAKITKVFSGGAARGIENLFMKVDLLVDESKTAISKLNALQELLFGSTYKRDAS